MLFPQTAQIFGGIINQKMYFLDLNQLKEVSDYNQKAQENFRLQLMDGQKHQNEVFRWFIYSS